MTAIEQERERTIAMIHRSAVRQGCCDVRVVVACPYSDPFGRVCCLLAGHAGTCDGGEPDCWGY